MLHTQDTAPDFTLLNQDKAERSLSDYSGTWKIMYFYPKDDTPGCTKEACAIRDVYHEFETLSVPVIGVSKDSPEEHLAFAKKYDLPFTLLSDPTSDMIAAYGALQEQHTNGELSPGIQRISYLIDPHNIIVKAYPNVDPAGHALELLADIKELTSSV